MVIRARSSHLADLRVPQLRQHLGSQTGPSPPAVLARRRVADPMQPIHDAAMPPVPLQQDRRVGKRPGMLVII